MKLGDSRSTRALKIPALIGLALLCLICVASAEARKPSGDKNPKPVATPASVTTPEAPPVTPFAAAAAPNSPAPQDPCFTDPRCSELYEKARTLSLANQYEAAVVMYQQAYAMKPLRWLLLNIGRMQQKLGRHEQAAASYRKILDLSAKLPPAETSAVPDAEVTATAREYLKQAETAVAEQKQLSPIAAPPAAPPKEKVPIHKKWWFWTVIGGGVAALGIGLGVGLSASGSGPRVPSNTDIFYPNL